MHYIILLRLILELLGFFPCTFWQVLVYLSKYLIFFQISSLSSMKKPKNSLELPNPTRATRKFSNKSMTDTCGGINLQSKQDIICHVPKLQPLTSAHYVADVIPFFSAECTTGMVWELTALRHYCSMALWQ